MLTRIKFRIIYLLVSHLETKILLYTTSLTEFIWFNTGSICSVCSMNGGDFLTSWSTANCHMVLLHSVKIWSYFLTGYKCFILVTPGINSTVILAGSCEAYFLQKLLVLCSDITLIKGRDKAFRMLTPREQHMSKFCTYITFHVGNR